MGSSGIKHRNLKNAFWKKMITARKAAHLRMDKALRAKALAIKAWKLAVIKRKHAQNKRNGAIRAKIAMVKSMKKHIKKAINWAIKMKLKHKAMMKAKNIMLKLKVSLKKLIAEHKVMGSDAAKVRLGERIAKLKKQLKHRKLDHKIKISHWKAVAARKAKEMRRVNQKVEDQEAKTKRAKAATKKAINLKIKFDLLSKKENRMKLHFMRLAKIARGHVKVARNEHRRQVKMKKDMLAKYARITAKNLRKAKSTVRREVRVTLKAHRAKRSWMRKESRSLVRLAKEKARMLTI